jgi:hypothetical protein
MATTYVKTISLDCDEVAVVLMALAERRIECQRLAEKYAAGYPHCSSELVTYWARSVAECEAIQARFAALTYSEQTTPTTIDSVVASDTITNDELASILEEEALEDARLAAEEAEWEEQEAERRQAAYDHDSRFEYEYEDRLNPAPVDDPDDDWMWQGGGIRRG